MSAIWKPCRVCGKPGSHASVGFVYWCDDHVPTNQRTLDTRKLDLAAPKPTEGESE